MHKIKKQHFAKKHGFTLIELMLVIAIVTTMTAVVFVSNNDKKANEDVASAGRQIAAMLRLAQSNALNGKMEGDQRVKYFGIRLENSASSNVNVREYYLTVAPNASEVSVLHVIKNVQFVGDDDSCGTGDHAVSFDSAINIPGGVNQCGLGIDGKAFQILITSTRKTGVSYSVCGKKTGSIEEGKGVSCPI